MEIKIILGSVAVLLALGSSYLYIKDIFRGNTKPHIYTWLIWSIVTVLAFLGQWVSGGGPGSWTTGVTAIITISIFFLSLKYGTKDITKFDKVCLALALISIIPWLITKNILWSVILASFTDVVGFFPTMRKTWNAPHSESLGSMFFDAFKHGLSIASLRTYSITTWLYPLSVLVIKIIIIGEIVFLRNFMNIENYNIGMLRFILNIPYTIVGFILALISVPKRILFRINPYAFIFDVKSFWWVIGYMKNARAITFGNVVILGPKLEDKDLEHELIHVEQFQRMPFVFPILYYVELIKNGYRNNKYEDEAYKKAGNIYKGK